MQGLIGDELMGPLRDIAWLMPPGCFVEVGVYQGGSAAWLYRLAEEQGRELFLYDTFTGIPMRRDDCDHHFVGDFSDCSYEEVRDAFPRAEVIKGLFPDSIVPMPGIAFVHADADQYESTKNICKVLGPLMVSGGVMLFDDYRGLTGCIKAVDECFPRRHVMADGRAMVKF